MSDESDDIQPESEIDFGPTEIAVGSGVGETIPAIAIPEVLPVLPLKNTVLFPFLLSPLLVSSTRSKKLIDEVLLSPQRVLICTAVSKDIDDSPGPDDVYRVGTIMRIAKMLKFPDDTYRLLVQGIGRARIDSFEAKDPFLRGRISRLEETGDAESVEVTALVRIVAQEFGALVAESARLSDELQILAAGQDPLQKC